jgi:EAL domain-containing protein (putative c-di-GMP-specific phosphodiesterase class I)
MISVNVSGQSVGDRAFHRYATELLADAGPAICQKLCLELTETTAISGMADACSFIERVRALGVRVALDDFGAGASFFGYLKQLNVDYLKIDGQFIRDLLDDPLDEVAVRCFIEVASTVGIQTVAEFVDQPQVLERLKLLGVDYAQGYLLHKPEPFERILVG